MPNRDIHQSRQRTVIPNNLVASIVCIRGSRPFDASRVGAGIRRDCRGSVRQSSYFRFQSQRPLISQHHHDKGVASTARYYFADESNKNTRWICEKRMQLPEELKAAGLIVPEPKPPLPFVVCAEYIPDRYTDVNTSGFARCV